MPNFHNILFPIDVSLHASHSIERKTDVVTLASGHEERNSRWAFARRRFTFGYGVKSLPMLAKIYQFYNERKGRFYAFRFRDKLDYKSCDIEQNHTAFDQFIGTSDGSTKVYQLKKTTLNNERVITKPVVGSVLIAVDGVETTFFTVDDKTGLVTFTTAPSVGLTITAGFLFDVPVRFESDTLNINFKSFNAAEAPTIALIEVRE